ncbi:hypothetical protein SKAU_G00374640 [Synaphobranchus kaupii]|uniref:Uncharacterized protein n=1 Tax=Synaphobranchus kaupii TaxID=118154 RepID=A0A9Q1EGQ4_SYNKA|nr:hypothetical protein SKAU_G00374640 [Synaphobranchus kaupii]
MSRGPGSVTQRTEKVGRHPPKASWPSARRGHSSVRRREAGSLTGSPHGDGPFSSPPRETPSPQCSGAPKEWSANQNRKYLTVGTSSCNGGGRMGVCTLARRPAAPDVCATRARPGRLLLSGSRKFPGDGSIAPPLPPALSPSPHPGVPPLLRPRG